MSNYIFAQRDKNGNCPPGTTKMVLENTEGEQFLVCQSACGDDNCSGYPEISIKNGTITNDQKGVEIYPQYQYFYNYNDKGDCTYGADSVTSMDPNCCQGAEDSMCPNNDFYENKAISYSYKYKKGKGLMIFIILLIVVLTAVGLFFAWKKYSKDKVDTPEFSP